MIELSFWNSSGPHRLSSSFHGAAGSPCSGVLKERELMLLLFIPDLGSDLNYFIEVNICLFYIEFDVGLHYMLREKKKSIAIFKGYLCSNMCIFYFSEFLILHVSTLFSLCE